MFQLLEIFISEYFDQNPISQVRISRLHPDAIYSSLITRKYGQIRLHLIEIEDLTNYRVYPTGSIVIALVRVLVCPSVFKYLRDGSLVFSEILHEVRGQ